MANKTTKMDAPPVIHASLPRMGTMSMSEAYKTLGFRAHHVLTGSDSDNDWRTFLRAVDGRYPNQPGADPTAKPFTRVDWDAVRGQGSWDLFTDLYAHFSVDIIKAYPESKVVVVQRDFDSWWESYDSQCLQSIQRWWLKYISLMMRIALGVQIERAWCNLYQGFHRVQHVSQIDKETARKSYDRFFAEVRALVPEERRLEFTLKDGWEPFCEFLGKPVPDMPFPRVNSREEHEVTQQKMMWRALGKFFVGAGAVGAAVYGVVLATRL
ncbi:hypothetical protein F5X68DRAFT_250688 [Plectosphaerella plurivora]|uniref:Uncharacterized protein n=1 Tax=Plectosphaerella plurivora TaxID=936078 RepID=A0A9P8VJQ2_9PEZI|nr:hypothetical protein F5X68DRAFT_250688 [Plectosphaerella plurivora]